MSQSILITYLRLNLLELGGEDSRLEKLNSAASELADSYARTPEDALPVLIACIGNQDEQHEAFENVATAIGNHWATYNGAFKDGTPTTLYKAVALQALVEAIEAQPVLGVAVSLLMRNFISYLNAGKSEPAFRILFEAADAAYKTELSRSAVSKSTKALGAPTAAAPSKANRADLKKRFDAAVGPTLNTGETIEGGNPSWPASNDVWARVFSEKAANLVADYIDAAAKWSSELDKKNLHAFATQISTHITEQFAPVREATSLLWWRQALYSNSAEQPYRKLTPTEMVAHMVSDLATLTPPVYEKALESFLVETMLTVIPQSEEISGAELRKISSKGKDALDNLYEYYAPNGLLLFAIEKDEASFKHSDVSNHPAKWAVWLLREIKALQALANQVEIPEKTDEKDGDE